MKIEDLKELKNKNPKKFIKEIIKLNINRDETPEIMNYVDTEVGAERNSTLETSILYNNIQEFKLILEPKVLVDYKAAVYARNAIIYGILAYINEYSTQRITLQNFIMYCPPEIRSAFEKTSRNSFKQKEATEKIVNYYIKELNRLPVKSNSNSRNSVKNKERKREELLEETRIADYLSKYKLYLTNNVIKKFCIDTFITYYLTKEEQFNIFKNYVEKNGWPKQDQGKIEVHTLSHRLYYWAKSLLAKDPDIVEKQYPGFFEFAERYHTTRRINIKKKSESWSKIFVEWCNKFNDYPRINYTIGKNKIPKAAMLYQIMILAYNPDIRCTNKLSEEEAEIIRKTSELYGYKYIKRREIHFDDYVSWVKQNKKLPKRNLSNKEENSLAGYRYNHKNDEKIIQINTLVKYLEISDKARELLENY